MNTPKPAVVDEATLDWEGWSDPTLPSRSAIRWKLLITGERTASRGLITGVAQLAPGAQLPPHHHEPEETYYIISGQGEMEIDDDTTVVGPGCAIYIPANAGTRSDAPARSHCASCSPSGGIASTRSSTTSVQ